MSNARLIQRDGSINNWGAWAIVGLTLVALLTRVYQLSEWNYYFDEIATVDYAADRYDGIVNPAYYVLVLLSFKLFGATELAARLPAMLLGVASVPIFFCTWRNVVGRNAAFVGTLLILFSSWHLYFSQFSRFYTGAFLFGSLTYYLFYQALVHDDLKRLVSSLVAAGIGFLFHATVVIAPAACAFYALVLLISRRSAQSTLSRRVAKVYVWICAVGGILALGVLLAIWQNRQARGVQWGDLPLEMIFQVIRQVQLPIVVAAFFGFVVLLRRNGWLALYLLTGILVPAIFVIAAAAFLDSRAVYLFYSLPLFFVLAGVICEEVRQALSKRQPIASHALTALLLLTLVPEMLSHYAGRLTLDVRDAVAFVEAERDPEDVVLTFANEFEFYARDKYPVVLVGGQSRTTKQDWQYILGNAIGTHKRAWIVVRRWRKPLTRGLESWLEEHGRLVWRRFETRYDYTAHGYEIFRVDFSDE